jgi:hypothetical protein
MWFFFTVIEKVFNKNRCLRFKETGYEIHILELDR